MNFPKLQARFDLDTDELVDRLGRVVGLLPFNSDTRSKGASLAAHLEAALEGKPFGQTSFGDEPAGHPLAGAAAGQPPSDAKGEPPTTEPQFSPDDADTSRAHVDPHDTPVVGQPEPLGAKKRK